MDKRDEYLRNENNTSHYYVYEWFIEDTGEVFYVGYGKGDKYKEFHKSEPLAEEVKKKYKTSTRFIKEGLTEECARYYKEHEMIKLINESHYCLTNRAFPFGTDKVGGYDRSHNTPGYRFETAPILYTTDSEEHYLGLQGRPFDTPTLKDLYRPHIIDKRVSRLEQEIIYGGEFERYYQETLSYFSINQSILIKSKYAKSVSAWVYPGDDYYYNYIIDENNALERIGRNIPVFHLVDVWKLLVDNYGSVNIEENEQLSF